MTWLEWFRTELSRRRLPWVVVLLAVVLGTPALWTGLHVDDFLARAILKQTPFAEEHYGGPCAPCAGA